MRFAGWRRQLRQCPWTQRRDRFSNPEDPVAEPGDDPIVSQAVDGVDEVGALSEGVDAASADADLQGEFDRMDRRRPSGSLEVPRHGPGEKYRRWPEKRCVDDLEVRVREREGPFTAHCQRTQPQALPGLELGVGRVGVAIGEFRAHGPPLRNILSEGVEWPAIANTGSSPKCETGQRELTQFCHH